MLLQDFSGGVNTRVAPSLLSPNESQLYINIDNSAGSIRPVKGSVDTTVAMDKYFTYYNANTEFISRATESSYIEYRDILYSTDVASYPKKYDGTNTYKLGIVAPTFTVTYVVLPASYFINPSNLDGTYSYAYTYYNATTGVESAPKIDSSDEFVIVAGDPYIALSDLVASTDPQVTHLRVYRIGGTLSDYHLQEEIPNASLPGQHVDNIADIDIAGNQILDTIENLPAPSTLKYLTTSYAMMFGAVGDKLYYSKIGKPDYWPATNFLDFADTITGIGVITNGLLVFTKYEVHIVTGNSPDTFSRYLMSGEQGCESHYTIQYTANSLIWLSQDGICATNGGEISVISAPKMGKLSLQGVNNAAVLDRVYYLSHAGGILIYDFRYNQIIRGIDTIVDWLGSYTDKLYSADTPAGGVSTRYQMLAGTDMSYTYKSPILTEGSYSTFKKFKDFYIKYNGSITIKLYVDGVLTNSKALTGNSCYDLKSISTASGYGLVIEITGTGEVSEIEFKALGRQNGR